MKKYLVIIITTFGAHLMEAQQSSMRFSLQQAIDYAIENSYNTTVSKKEIESAKREKWETTTMGLPQIEGVINYQNFLKQQVTLFDTNGDGINEQFTFGTQQNINASVTVSQLLFDGSYLVGLQSARTFLKISEQANEKTELLTREAVINAYGNVLISEKSLEILENNKKVLQKNLNDAKKIFENGLNEEETVEQLEITLGNTESQLNSVRRLRSIAYQMLNITLGNDISVEVILTDTLDSLTQSNINFELISQPFNVDDHIDFRIAQNDRESKRLLMRYEQTQALPSLKAFANFGSQANSDVFSFFNGNQQWFNYSLLGVSLQVPLFTSLKRSARTQRAKINLDIADVRLKETREKLHLQVQRSKSDYQLSIENYNTAKKNLTLAERIEKKQQIKFFEGLSSSFDLAQAQNQLYSQQQIFIQSMLDVVAKKAALENALNIPLK
ncbi:MAG: Uncharacterised protein [Flavobacterium sp. SCGC AAA160-P02]|nr:MAG: Uncharacterised protein [Flavobacterium sp. SCGC AAA160-P02]